MKIYKKTIIMLMLIISCIAAFNSKAVFADVNMELVGKDTYNPKPGINPGGSGYVKPVSPYEDPTGSGGRVIKPPKIVEKDIYQDIVKNDQVRIVDIIAARWTTQTGYMPSDNHAKKTYNMLNSTILNPDYPATKTKKVTNKWVDDNGREYKIIYTYYTPRLYAKIDKQDSISFKDNYKTLYFLWNLHGPIQLAHNADRTGNFTDSSITWHGQQTEFVKIPENKPAVGKYQSDSQPYKKWDIMGQDLYHYTYYEDWGGKFPTKEVGSGNWNTPPVNTGKTGEGLMPPLVTHNFSVALQELGGIKQIREYEVIDKADIKIQLIK